MWSDEIKSLVKSWKMKGKSYNEISKLLNVSKSSIQNLCKYINKRHNKKRGPKFSLQNFDKIVIKREVNRCLMSKEKINSRKIIGKCSLKQSKWTIQRHLKRLNLKYGKAKSKVFLNKKSKENRVNMIHQWISKNQNFQKVIFSDEKRFSFDGCDDWRSYVPMGQKIYHKKRISGGGSVMVYMMMLPTGLLSYRFINGNFNSSKYLNILSELTIPISKLNMGDDFFLQHDNSRCHTAKIITEFLSASNIKVIKWPAISPDLNIVEDVWRMIAELVYDGPQYDNSMKLKENISNAILLINQQHRGNLCQLYESFGSRIAKTLQKNGETFNK